MKIGIAQTLSLKGEVRQNIKNHLRMVDRAIELKADLIVFPELSITNYEPDLAKELATHIEDAIFNPFQTKSDKNEITIGIGMPTKAKNGINISMLIFQPNKNRTVYSKQLLHPDELEHFVSGKQQTYLKIKNKKIAFGICYEALQAEHFLNARQNGSDIYIASVAKPQRGIEKAYQYFPQKANEFETPVLMSNCLGQCDDFQSVGQSAVWNKKGDLIGQLDNENEGILIYDLDLDTVENFQLKIEKGQLSDLNELFQIYQSGKRKLERSGNHQWNDNYPTISTIENDLRKGVLYTLKSGNEAVGAINLSEEQDEEYQTVDWQFDDSKILVIHRLVISPKHQKQGYATRLMDFAENLARENDYTSIRLDVYSQNKGAIEMYKKRNYHMRGDVNFSEREYAFHCMEMEVKKFD